MVDTSAVTIREMRGEDIEALAQALDMPYQRINNRWRELVAGYRDVFVAQVDGRPVATVSINERPERPGLLHLFALDVAEPSRNSGIGTHMIAVVEAEARHRRLDGVYLEVAVENVHARRLYKRLGYAQDGQPFQGSWQRHGADGAVDEIVELQLRMVKRFIQGDLQVTRAPSA